ncbi:dihydrolipoamide acetyltransferase family protein [Bhargavaea massiliensis]|uniref:dihydrolipoamide acetyltransferase family protein n=1 Tax=Bhargavaea massiliensis TaxID=2697500 RepID=UPI001BD14649|nr:dihydrolipoamide acetyltransferase family protein [Bhargavaea massiliensis]
MSGQIVMPKLGMTMTEGTITEWYKDVGDPVEKGEPILMISSDKLTQDIEAPESGILLEKRGDTDSLLPVGEVLAVIGEEGAAPIPEVRSAKEPAAVMPAEPEHSVVSAEQAPKETSTRPESDRIFVTPLARRIAEAEGVDLHSIEGSGGNGRITKRDVERALVQREATGILAEAESAIQERASLASGQAIAPQPAAEAGVGEGLSPMRKAIAKNMRRSLAETAQLTLHRKADGNALIEFQQTLKRELVNAGYDTKLTLTVLLARAAVLALQEVKSLNATYRDGKLTEHDEVHLGIATSLDHGLVVPVIRDAHQRTIGALAEDIREATEQARSGAASPSLLAGSTFTITNLGASGVEYFTPILNPPETGILGVGALQDELALSEDGSVKQVKKIPLSLTFDHQIVDGALAAAFLTALVKYIETPYLLVL